VIATPLLTIDPRASTALDRRTNGPRIGLPAPGGSPAALTAVHREPPQQAEEVAHLIRESERRSGALTPRISNGKVPPPAAVLVDQFPEYPDLAADPARRRLTVAHALTMTMGLEWNENLPYTSAANSEIAMERAPDRYRFVLERPVREAPGSSWGYNGGATALLGRIIARGVGAALPDHAETVLFGPLGIAQFEWIRGQDGAPSAASGLRLTPRDLLLIGQLIIQGGRWEGRPVVPPSWIEASFRSAVVIDGPVRYGLHWYLGEAPVAAKSGRRLEPWVGAFGNGGQRLFVMPGPELAVVITAGNYNQPDQFQMPLRLWRDIVLPGLIVD
jgi:CubicO group peptidase (beta-lactamase class C family)